MPNYWLLKSEPDSYSIGDLKRDRTTSWSGVRNYQARNFMRDQMKVGDLALFYHSGSEGKAEPAIVGIAKVARAAYADATAFDSKDSHYDPKSTKDDPIWVNVDVQYVEKFKSPVTLKELKAEPKLAAMLVLKRGQRLSIMPVEAKHFELVRKMGSQNI